MSGRFNSTTFSYSLKDAGVWDTARYQKTYCLKSYKLFSEVEVEVRAALKVNPWR